MKKIRFLLLDDHTLFLHGLKILLKEMYPESEIICYTSINDSFNKIKFSKNDFLISDLEIPDENILAYLELNKEHLPPVLVVSMHKKLSLLNKCKTIGIEGYILKNDHEFLKPAIDAILDGRSYYSSSLNSLLNDSNQLIVDLTPREEEVIKCIYEGLSNQRIAEKLFVGIETIKTHKRNIKTKLGAKDNQAIIEYVKQNLIV